LGALARSALAQGFPVRAGQRRWPTCAVNPLASLLLSYFTTRLQERLPSYTYRCAFFGTGVCGALSAFSVRSGKRAAHGSCCTSAPLHT